MGDPYAVAVMPMKKTFLGFEQSILILLPQKHAGLRCLRENDFSQDLADEWESLRNIHQMPMLSHP